MFRLARLPDTMKKRPLEAPNERRPARAVAEPRIVAGGGSPVRYHRGMDRELVTLVVREANVVLGGVAFFWLLFKVNKHWGGYPLPFRAYSMSLILFTFAVSYSAAEAIALSSPIGLRSWFALVANLSLLWALWQMRGRHTVSKTERVRR